MQLSSPNFDRGSASAAPSAPPTVAVYAMFFLSGMGALIFENVWFSQTGLIVGNSVWSAALVVGAFMGGLAIGNAIAAWTAPRWRSLVGVYGWMEVVSAVSGAALVLTFPLLPGVLQPLLAPYLDSPAALNLSRSMIAFALMVIPAAALGTTLPLLTRPLELVTGNYGFALGRLYGLNTLGAVTGTLLAEWVLVGALGLRGSGLFAAVCNLTAAFVALRIAGHPAFAHAVAGAAPMPRLQLPALALLVAAFLSGAAFLGLEVVWFRFLLLYLYGTSMVFATMLAVVLAGIGVGGVIASRLLRLGWHAGSIARVSVVGAAIGIVVGYRVHHDLWSLLSGHCSAAVLSGVLSLALMGPVSLFSGALFTALGAELNRRVANAVTSTGLLALLNTLGAMFGSLLSAFLILPYLGLEASFFWFAALYASLLLLLPAADGRSAWRFASVAAALLALALFPFGNMQVTQHKRLVEQFGGTLVASREGVVETAYYLRTDFVGKPLDYRLVTNSVPMSTTDIRAQRYMRLFAYLPASLHPRIEKALLICFGVGTTARALAELPDVQSIDIVDVSRDVLELNSVVAPPNPLADPRVRVHIEDGRFFLQHSEQEFDLITGEPPPPNMAGMATLYSREYFELMHSRLKPGGIATYWLPFRQLPEVEGLAVMAAFCAAFADCSLWSGVDTEWILMGSRGGLKPVTREHFARLWDLPAAGAGLRAIGIERPEHLVAQFIADAPALHAYFGQVAPVTDNFPRRLSGDMPVWFVEQLSPAISRSERSRTELLRSGWVADLLPGELIAASADQVWHRDIADVALFPTLRMPQSNRWFELEAVLARTDLVNLPRWLLGSEARKVQMAADGDAADPQVIEQSQIDKLSRRIPPAIDRDPDSWARMTPLSRRVRLMHLCLAGGEAASAAHAALGTQADADIEFQQWFDSRCAIDP